MYRNKKTFNDYSDSIIEFDRGCVDLRNLSPKQDFVAEIVRRVARGGNTNRPGIAIIPDTRNILETKSRASQYAENLLEGFRSFAGKEHPQALVQQPCIGSPSKARRYTARTKPEIYSIVVNGVHSDKAFHMDILQHLFVFLSYSVTRNVCGGVPKFLDVLRMVEEEKYTSVHDIMKFCPAGQNSHVHTPNELHMELKAGLGGEINRYVKKISGHKPHRFPIVIFSNRTEDGIMHGATRVTIKNPAIPASRLIEYGAIGAG